MVRTSALKKTVLAATALALSTSTALAACPTAGKVEPVKASNFSSVDRAHAMRILQSEMMVAGLSCGAKPQYNAFATKYKTVLTKNGDRLKKHYYAEYGASAGFKKLNTFVTRLANEASVRIAMSGPGYCQKALQRFDLLLASPIETLEQYSAVYAVDLGMKPTTPVAVQTNTAANDCVSGEDKVALTEE